MKTFLHDKNEIDQAMIAFKPLYSVPGKRERANMSLLKKSVLALCLAQCGSASATGLLQACEAALKNEAIHLS